MNIFSPYRFLKVIDSVGEKIVFEEPNPQKPTANTAIHTNGVALSVWDIGPDVEVTADTGLMVSVNVSHIHIFKMTNVDLKLMLFTP